MNFNFTTRPAIYLIYPPLLALLFIISFSLCAKSFFQYRENSSTLSRLSQESAALQRDVARLKKQAKFFPLVEQLENKAQQLGLKRENFRQHDIQITKTMTLEEASSILEQMTHSRAYFFKPETFELKFLKASQESRRPKQDPPSSPTPAIAPSPEVNLQIKGTFLVRES